MSILTSDNIKSLYEEKEVRIVKYPQPAASIVDLKLQSIIGSIQRNTTKSLCASLIRNELTRHGNMELNNVSIEVFDQKDSNLCVSISTTTLFRHSVKEIMEIEGNNHYHRFFKLGYKK